MTPPKDMIEFRPPEIADPLILLVEDDPRCAKIATRRLETEGYRVVHAPDGTAGLEKARELRPDLVITDWMMPGLDGPSLCEALRADRRLAGTFVMIYSNRGERAERIEGLDRGADDYLAKEVTHEELVARVRAGLRIRALQLALIEQSRRDPLTGLVNRAFFYERLRDEMARARRTHRPITVAMLDLDGFKSINDDLGHLAGDAALRHVGALLLEHSRETDVVARYGGDEFAMIFTSGDAKTCAEPLERVGRALVLDPFRFEGRTAPFGISYGLAEVDLAGGEGPEDLIRRADLALYVMKRGRHALR